LFRLIDVLRGHDQVSGAGSQCPHNTNHVITPPRASS
jgi:hypothetical protein